MRRAMFVIVIIAFVASSAALFGYRGELRDAYRRWQRGPVPQAVSRAEVLRRQGATVRAESPTPKATPTAAPEPRQPAEKPSAPSAMNLRVIFVPQAPFKVWDGTHEETCEEASMAMLKAYLDGTDAMTPDEMEKILLGIVEYEQKTYGDFKSTDAARTVDIMRDHLGMTGAKVVPISSLDDVKREIAAGRPVMLPAAGRLLKNPNFKNGGPLYHMLLAKGYTATTIVTNDPGTRLGADYVYADDVLWNAIHDWNGGDVENGAKVMITAGE